MGLLGEAVRAIALACNLSLLLPGLAVTALAGRRAPLAAGAYLGVAAVIRWAQTSAWIEAPGDMVAAILVVVGVAGVALGRRAMAAERGLAHDGGVAAGAGLVGASMALLWRPCTGEHLGNAISTTLTSPVAGFAPLSVYLLVVSLPVVILAAVSVVVPGVGKALASSFSGAVSGLFGVAVAASLALGTWHDLVGELYRRSGGA